MTRGFVGWDGDGEWIGLPHGDEWKAYLFIILKLTVNIMKRGNTKRNILLRREYNMSIVICESLRIMTLCVPFCFNLEWKHRVIFEYRLKQLKIVRLHREVRTTMTTFCSIPRETTDIDCFYNNYHYYD